MENTIKYKGYTISVRPEEYASSPNDMDDESLFLIANHRQFSVRPNDMNKEFISRMAETHHVFKVEAYIHSGVTLSLPNEADTDIDWDVSRCAIAFASKEEWPDRSEAEKAVRSLLKEWNTYLEGDVWVASVTDEFGETLDSCGDIYGYDEAVSMSKNTVDGYAKNDARIGRRVRTNVRRALLAVAGYVEALSKRLA